MPSDVRKMSDDTLIASAIVCGVPENASAVTELARRIEIMREFVRAAAEKEPNETDDDARWIERHAARAALILETE